MNRLIRVILSLNSDNWHRGLYDAEQRLRGFGSAIGSIVSFGSHMLMGMQAAIGLIGGAFRTVGNVLQTLKTEFIDAAQAVHRQEAAFTSLTGDAGQAAEMMDFLQDVSLTYGKSLEGLLPSAQQVAVALRAQNGAVDINQWKQMVMLVAKFQTLRPDVPIELWGRAISGFLAGDPTTLTRLLDVNVRQIAQLSAEAKAFLGSAQGATETQLGSVTRLGEEAGQAAGDALAFLEEVAEAVGATDDLLDQTTLQSDILREHFNQLKRSVGDELLPIWNDLLSLLLTALVEHKDDIGVVIDKFGEWARLNFDKLITAVEKVFEFLGSPEGRAAIKDVADGFREIGKVSLANIIAFFRDIDWEEVKENVLAILEATAGIIDLAGGAKERKEEREAERKQEREQEQDKGKHWLDPVREPNIGQGLNIWDIIAEWKLAGQVFKDAADKIDQSSAREQNVNVNIVWTVDEDGRISMREVAQDEVEKGMEDVIGSTTTGTASGKHVAGSGQ